MRWAETIEPAPHYVLGALLGPLRFGHMVIFERIGLDVVKTPDELWTAVQIARRTHAGARDWLTFDASIQGELCRWIGVALFAKPQFMAARSQLAEWMEQNTGTPEILIPTDTPSAHSFGAPTLASLRVTATTRLGYAPETLNDQPFGQVLWDCMTHNEANGGVRILDDDLKRNIEKLQCRASS